MLPESSTTTTPPSTESILACLREADALTARAVGMLASHPGRLESSSGLPAEILLRLGARRCGWDARDLAGAAEVLAHMPRTAALVTEQVLSWSQLRGIARAVRDLSASERAQVDQVVAEEAPRLIEADPELIVHRADDEVAGLRADRVRAKEDRQIQSELLVPAAPPGRRGLPVRGGRYRGLRRHLRRGGCNRRAPGLS